jgi:hypothetical protein
MAQATERSAAASAPGPAQRSPSPVGFGSGAARVLSTGYSQSLFHQSDEAVGVGRATPGLGFEAAARSPSARRIGHEVSSGSAASHAIGTVSARASSPLKAQGKGKSRSGVPSFSTATRGASHSSHW